MRHAIEAAYAQHVAANTPFDVSYIAGEEPGTSYYGYDSASSTYWAVVTFVPSSTAVQRYHELPPNSSINLAFQDPPVILSRSSAGAWRYVMNGGGGVCSPPLPEALLQVWALPRDTNVYPPGADDCRHLPPPSG